MWPVMRVGLDRMRHESPKDRGKMRMKEKKKMVKLYGEECGVSPQRRRKEGLEKGVKEERQRRSEGVRRRREGTFS